MFGQGPMVGPRATGGRPARAVLPMCHGLLAARALSPRATRRLVRQGCPLPLQLLEALPPPSPEDRPSLSRDPVRIRLRGEGVVQLPMRGESHQGSAMSSTGFAGPPDATAKPTPSTGQPAAPPRRLRWAWDVVLALGTLAFVPILAAAIPLWAYLCGLGYAGAWSSILLASFATVLLSSVALVVRLVVFWRRCGWLARVLRLVPVALVLLLLVPSSPISIRRLGPLIDTLIPDDMTLYLWGFRDRMRATADWEAIRQWARDARSSRPEGDSAPLQRPPCIQDLDPWQLTLANDAVVLKWHITYAFINPPTCAALIVFADEDRELVSRPDAHRIAPGVWVAYWPAFDEDEDAGLHRRRLLGAETCSSSVVSPLSACCSPRSRRANPRSEIASPRPQVRRKSSAVMTTNPIMTPNVAVRS